MNVVQPYLLQLGVPTFLEETVAGTVAFLPRLVGALVVLLIGWILGVAVAKVVRRVANRVEIDRMVLETPLGRILGGTEAAVSNAFGTLAKWSVYALAILAAANVLAIPLLSEWVSTAVSYLPAFVAGLLVILLGFVVADFIGDAIMRTRAATQTAYTAWFATGTRMFLYFTAIVIGLDTMGVDVGILYVFAEAVAWGLAAAVAIGVGIAVGWGGTPTFRRTSTAGWGERPPERHLLAVPRRLTGARSPPPTIEPTSVGTSIRVYLARYRGGSPAVCPSSIGL